MTFLTQDEVRSLFIDVGMLPRRARIGSAIALCESPVFESSMPMSDFGAIGDQELADDKWGYSYGGLMIRSLREQKGTGGIRDEDRLLEPRFNVRSARAIYRQAGNWNDWSVYTSGKYKAYLQDIYPPEPGTYVVVAGDSLSKIASEHGWFTWEELARVNGLHAPYSIGIGQTLQLPPTP